jgi:hypothetical protein
MEEPLALLWTRRVVVNTRKMYQRLLHADAARRDNFLHQVSPSAESHDIAGLGKSCGILASLQCVRG